MREGQIEKFPVDWKGTSDMCEGGGNKRELSYATCVDLGFYLRRSLKVMRPSKRASLEQFGH